MGGGRGAAVITVLLPVGVVESPSRGNGERARPDEGEQHHLRVRRAREGERVALRDGAGLVATGRLALAGKAWEVEIEAAERRPRPAELTLVVGAGDRERFGWVVEKAAELGATRVVPLMTVRSRDVGSRVKESHLEKLRRVALEATKQCGSAWAVDVAAPAALEDILQGAAGDGFEVMHRWLAHETGAPPPPSLDATPVIVVVGPEGGLEDGERRVAEAAGFRPTALSPHTLRFETAALAAAAVVSAARLRGTHG